MINKFYIEFTKLLIKVYNILVDLFRFFNLLFNNLIADFWIIK